MVSSSSGSCLSVMVGESAQSPNSSLTSARSAETTRTTRNCAGQALPPELKETTATSPCERFGKNASKWTKDSPSVCRTVRLPRRSSHLRSDSSPTRWMPSTPDFVGRVSPSPPPVCARAGACRARRRSTAAAAAGRRIESLLSVIVTTVVVAVPRRVRVEGALGPAPPLEAEVPDGEEHRDDRERDEQEQQVHHPRHALLDAHGELRRRRLVPVLPLRFEPHRVAPLGQRRQVGHLLRVALAPRLPVLDAAVGLHRQVELLDEPRLLVDEVAGDVEPVVVHVERAPRHAQVAPAGQLYRVGEDDPRPPDAAARALRR